jgi:hypothetical protein
MIRDAKCARFSLPNKTFATSNYNCEIVRNWRNSHQWRLGHDFQAKRMKA